MDPRVAKLAKVLVNYSLQVKPGDWVHVTSTYLAEDLLSAVCREIVDAGAHPTFHADLPELARIITAHGNVEAAVRALKLGAFDFLEKPLDADRVLVTLRNGLAQKDLKRKIVPPGLHDTR